jgi:hypothetical protein
MDFYVIFVGKCFGTKNEQKKYIDFLADIICCFDQVFRCVSISYNPEVVVLVLAAGLELCF